jgi:hypothetical protein
MVKMPNPPPTSPRPDPPPAPPTVPVTAPAQRRKEPQWFGIVFLPRTTPACIITPRGSVLTETKNRCWVCYGVLMLHAGYSDSDPRVYHLTCGACGTAHLANFPEGEIPAWLESRLHRDANPCICGCCPDGSDCGMSRDGTWGALDERIGG